MSRSVYLGLLLLCVVVAGIYSVGATGPLILDDWPNLSVLKRLPDPSDWKTAILTNNSGSLGRPVSMATFYAEYRLFGFNTIVFKATNIALHIGCGLLAFFLVRHLLRYRCDEKTVLLLAACSTVLWLGSPLSSSTVLYIIQRMAILSTLFTLLALLAYCRFRLLLNRGALSLPWLGAAVLATVAGLFSKESAALMPLFILVLEAYFLPAPADRLLARFRWFIVLVCGASILGAMSYVLINADRFFNFATRSFSAGERLLTQSRIMWEYVAAILVPQSNTFGLFHDDIEVSKSLVEPVSTLFATVAWWAVLVWLVWAQRQRSPVRMMAGGVAFFLAGHALESTVFNLELYFEHRNYLPSLGLYLSLVLFFYYGIARAQRLHRVAIAAFGCYALICLVALHQRALIWADGPSLIYSSHLGHPDSPRGNAEAALMDIRLGDFNGAVDKLNHAMTLKTSAKMGLYAQLVYTYCSFDVPGFPAERLKEISSLPMDGTAYTATALDALNEKYRMNACRQVPYSEFVTALFDRFMAYYDSGEINLNPALLNTTLSTQIRLMEALNYLVMTDKTLLLFDRMRQHGIDHLSPRLLAAVAMIDQNRLEEAGEVLRELRATPDLPADFEKHNLVNVEQLLASRLAGQRS